jgi:hypothetical protein
VEVEMKRFVASGIVLAAVPMSLLNPMGREAFLGYYLGVITMWLVFVIASGRQTTASTEIAGVEAAR